MLTQGRSRLKRQNAEVSTRCFVASLPAKCQASAADAKASLVKPLAERRSSLWMLGLIVSLSIYLLSSFAQAQTRSPTAIPGPGPAATVTSDSAASGSVVPPTHTPSRSSAGATTDTSETATSNGEVAVPRLTARVMDLTGTFSPSEQAQLETKLKTLEDEKGAQVFVLMVPTVQPDTVETYARRVFDQWKIGRQKVDDGILYLIAKIIFFLLKICWMEVIAIAFWI